MTRGLLIVAAFVLVLWIGGQALAGSECGNEASLPREIQESQAPVPSTPAQVLPEPGLTGKESPAPRLTPEERRRLLQRKRELEMGTAGESDR